MCIRDNDRTFQPSSSRSAASFSSRRTQKLRVPLALNLSSLPSKLRRTIFASSISTVPSPSAILNSLVEEALLPVSNTLALVAFARHFDEGCVIEPEGHV